MKTGKTLVQLAQEVERQQESKQDFIVNTNVLHMRADGKRLSIFPEDDIENPISYGIDNYCHNQIAQRLKIPKAYYDKMTEEAPDLLAYNVNNWFNRTPEKRMLRILDDNARAFLSDSYRPLDNIDLLTCVLPIISDYKCEVASCDVTSKKLYLKVLFPEMMGEVSVGDAVQAGLCISNSEIGAGSLRVEPLVYRLVCSNGMITSSALKKYHVGRRNGTNFDNFQELLSDKTKQVSDAAFWMQVTDIVKNSMQRDVFEGNVERLRESTENKIESKNIDKVIKKVQKKYTLSDTTGADMLRHLVEGGDLSQWGLANAVTRCANDAEDYDYATELERTGGKIIELEKTDWSAIANAV
jgi:hypothetical protein